MKKILLVAMLAVLGCAAAPASPVSQSPQKVPRCERWKAASGKWYVAHEVTDESHWHDGPCPCGMTTKDGHLYLQGVLSDDAEESPAIAPVSTAG